MLRKISLVLILTFAFIYMVPVAMAAPPVTVSPLYDYTTSIMARIDIDNGVAICSGSAKPTYSNTIAYLEVKLQRLENGTWKTIETWTDESNDGSRVSADGNKKVAKGYTYRVQSVLHISDINGVELETANVVSPVKSY